MGAINLENSTDKVESTPTETRAKRERIDHKRAFYGLALITILFLSIATVYLYSSNQVQQKQLINAQADDTANSMDSASAAINNFVDQYKLLTWLDLNAFALNTNLPSNYSFDVYANSTFVLSYIDAIGAVTTQDYEMFSGSMDKVEASTNCLNVTECYQIEETVGTAMGQTDIFGNESFTALATDVPIKANSLGDVLGLNSNSMQGLQGIAWSFQRMSEYYYAFENGANVKVMASPSYWLNLALSNATELSSALSAWKYYTANPALLSSPPD